MTDTSHDLQAALRSRFAAARASVAAPRPVAVPVTDAPLPLSAVQRGIWFLAQLEPDSAAYHLPTVLRLTGTLDEPALLAAVRAVAQRHPALRAVVVTDGPEPVLRQGATVPVSTVDMSEAGLAAALAEETGRPFRLTDEPPMRAVLYRLPDSWVLALTVHHLVTDATAERIMLADLAAAYAARVTGGAPALPPAPVPTRPGPVDPADLAWWVERLTGLEPVLDLPTDHRRTCTTAWPAAEVPVTVPTDLAERVRAYATRHGATPFMVLMAAWQALLGRLTGTDDVVVGVPHAGRHTAADDGVVSCFLDTVVLRTDLSGDPTGDELLARVRAGALAAVDRAAVPFERIVRELRPDRTGTTSPVFQAQLNVYDDVADPDLVGLRTERLFVHPRHAKLDLSLELADGGRGAPLRGWLIYRADLFEPETAARLVRWYLAQLAGMLAAPNEPVAAVELEPVTQPALAGPVTEPDHTPVHERIQRWADRTPDAPAVHARDGVLTYGELDTAANRLAHKLIGLGVEPDQPVAILLEPGAAFAVAVLGVLKAGGAYLPLDTTYPAARVAAMRTVAGARVVITTAELADRAGPGAVNLDVAGYPATRPAVSVSPNHLAHVIFTSGSTGEPKGIAVEHGNLAHSATVLLPRMAAGRSFAIVSTVAADLALTALYGAWLTGGALHLVDRETATDPAAFGAYLADHRVDAMKIVPSHLALLAGGPGRLAAVLPRKLLILGGEGVPWSLVGDVRRARPDLAVHTHYGATETTMMVLVCDVDEVAAGTGLVPLGRPLANMVGQVVDRAGRPVADGLPGELVLAGPGVSRGYVGRPELTEQRFTTGGYRTGDLVRTRDGELEFLGRTDDQVKVRGHRIELGEVTAALRALADVAAAVVLPDGTGNDRQLACWVVPVTGRDPRPDAIRAQLRDTLPAYMVPATVTMLPRLPLTPNGKVDRAKLPRPAAMPAAFVAPRTPAERALAEVWAELLGLERVGAGDDFFALGGHSFAATRMVGRVAEVTGVTLPVRLVFDRPVLAELAAELDRRDTATPITRRPDPAAPVPLSPAQERLWLLWRLRPTSDDYHTSVALRLAGRLEPDVLRAALTALADRYEVLRMVVTEFGAQPAAVPIGLSVVVGEVSVREEITRPFDLEAEPPLRALLARSSAGDTLVLTVHHIAVDAWSWGTILTDLAALYRAEPLPALPLQYADVAEYQRIRRDDGAEDSDLDWWADRLAGLPARLDLPTDRPRGPGAGWVAASVPLDLPATRLRARADEADCTPFEVLLTVWQSLLARLAATEDVAVGVPVSGRSLPGTDAMVGCFVNTLVLRADLSGDPTVRDALTATRVAMRDAVAHGDVPFERIVARLRPERDLNSTPLFQTMLNLIDLPAPATEFAGLPMTELPTPRADAQCDLALTLVDDGTGLAGTLTYRAGLFDAGTITRWARWFVALLDAVLAAGADDRILALDPVPATVLIGPDLPVGAPATVVEAVAIAAAARPDAVAVRDAAGSVTYAELMAESGSIAAALTGHDVVGVCLPRDRRLPAALLGVLRAGAAYLPLDPTDPPDRRAALIADAGATVVLTRESMVPAAEFTGPPPDPSATAYVLYTSGSTGRPKGVPITHANLAAFVAAMLAEPGMKPDDVTLGVVAYTFDVFGYELWVTLAAGATLAIADRETIVDGHALAEWMDRAGVSVMTATPTTLRLLAAAKWPGRPGLRVISIGELLDPPLARFLASRVGELWNAYGPTETTIYSTITQIREPVADPVPIGGPITGTRLSIVDCRGRPALPGSTGELWIGGAGVAAGYLNRPELTAERFVSGCYRTGDLVRWRPNGLEYLGRTDHQVKVRGHRIELGEIEAVLRGHPDLTDAVVTVADEHLVGYLVPRAGQLDVEPFLRERLPAALVPRRWVWLSALPTTPSGKVDRGALPEPAAAERVAAPPATAMQQLVARTWAEVLGIVGPGQEDDFFALGGHSRAATQVAGRLRAMLDITVPVRMLFEHPVLAAFATELERVMLDRLASEVGQA